RAATSATRTRRKSKISEGRSNVRINYEAIYLLYSLVGSSIYYNQVPVKINMNILLNLHLM
ncbi:MAG: hypothetical protein WBE68_26570, partial [Candidatus Nitrosopolaris sp.]